jgi:hypothetical protein
LKYPTCSITDAASATKTAPTTGKSSHCPVMKAATASDAPMASDPVSPMMTCAGCALNQRKPISAPVIVKQNVTTPSWPCR